MGTEEAQEEQSALGTEIAIGGVAGACGPSELQESADRKMMLTIEIVGEWQCRLPMDCKDIGAHFPTREGEQDLLPAITQVFTQPCRFCPAAQWQALSSCCPGCLTRAQSHIDWL